MVQYNNKVALVYIMDGVAYPVAMNESQFTVLQLLSKTFEPLAVIGDQPIGKVVNLYDKGRQP